MAETVELKGISRYRNGYRARAQYTNKETGEITKFSKSGFKTEIEALKARDEFLSSMKATGMYNGIKKVKFCDVYMEAIENSNYQPATVKRYKSIYENHIKKVFGNRYIASISTGQIEDFLNKLSRPTKDKKFGNDICYSQEYIAGFYKSFKAVFTYAWKHDYIKDNPMQKMGKTSFWYDKAKRKKEGRFLSKEELKVIDNTLKTSNLYTSFKLAIHTGMRISEIFAVLWEDVDFNRRVIEVNKQLLYNDDKKIWCFAPLKTGLEKRIIPIPDELYKYLMSLRIRQESEKAHLGECYRGNKDVTGVIDSDGQLKLVTGLDFVNKKLTGERLTPDSTKYATRKVEATTGKHRFLLDPNDITSDIDFSYHDFRHTYATICASNGVAVEDLQDILGHKKITTTKKFYLHKDEYNNPIRDAQINRIFNDLSNDMAKAELHEAVNNAKVDDAPKEELNPVNHVRAQKTETLGAGQFINGIWYKK